MSLTINTTMTTKDGGSVASGAHVLFSTFFPEGEFKYDVNITIYRDQASYDGGFSPIRGIMEVPSLSFSNELTESDFNLLTPAVLHGYVKDYLEGFLGADTVTINS